MQKMFYSRKGPKNSQTQFTVTTFYHIIILYHLFSFRRSVQDYKIHMEMEIVISRHLGIKRQDQYKMFNNHMVQYGI